LRAGTRIEQHADNGEIERGARSSPAATKWRQRECSGTPMC
jgi:hypothetical protein